MGWTDDRVATLKKLYADGLSASQIAKQLGGFPNSPDGGRNAVIGKIHRLGLNGPNKASAPSLPVFKTPRPVRLVRPARQVETVPEVARTATAAPPMQPVPMPVHRNEEPGSVTLLTIGAHMCKWPIGDPVSDSFTFCGRRNGDTGPYCREHAQVAYQQPQSGKKKTAANDLARSLHRYI